MDYCNEFQLKSCKWVFRYEDACIEELTPFLMIDIDTFY